MDEAFIDNLEENIEDIPQEAKDFIFGEGLKTVKAELVQNVDKEDEKLGLTNMLMFFLLGGKSEKELSDYIDTLTVSDEKKMAIRTIIQDKVIDELLLIIDVNEEMEQEASVVLPPAFSPKPIASLTSMTDRLKQASIATPPEKPVIDPYHEQIEP